MEVFMYLEQILEDIFVKQDKILSELESLKEKLNIISKKDFNEFVSLRQLIDSGVWPYTEMATRKMIQRKKLIEGYHYKKIDKRYIFSKKALINYLEQHFYNKKVS